MAEEGGTPKPPDIKQWVKQLKPDLGGLHDTMDQISEAKRDSERTLAAKNLAVETYQESYLRCSQLLEVVYRVSGNEHLADKLRPTIPKSRSQASTGDDPSEGSPEQTAGGDGDQATPDGAPQPGVRPDRPPAEVRPAEVRPAEVRPQRPTFEVRTDRPPAEVRPDRPPAETQS